MPKRPTLPPGRSPSTAASLWAGTTPIREELFGVERLERHAESLAATHAVTRQAPRGNPLVERLIANEEALSGAYEVIAAAAAAGTAISPAAEWFIDNYYVVEEQIRSTRRDLPRRFYEQLPKLADGPFAHLPQVFGIAWAYVAHTDSRFDRSTLERFVGAYERVRPLEIGELWALSITLRIVLIENLRRSVDRIVTALDERGRADEIADRLIGDERHEPEPIESVMRPYAHAPLPKAFTVQLVRRLHDFDPQVSPPRRWLETRLAVVGTTPEELVHADHYDQAAMNVTVGNVVTSLRSIAQVDWSAAVERLSLVDATLRAASEFAAMDFETRDRYRRAVEVLARGSRRSEAEVVERAVAATRAAHSAAASHAPVDPRRRDPGYFLIGEGRPALEAELGFVEPRPHLRGRLARIGLGGYLLVSAALAAAVLALPLLAVGLLGASPALLVVLGLIGLAPAADVALGLINRAAAARFEVHALPGLELGDGIPRELRTLVVMPVLLTDATSLQGQLERLEVHYLANRDDELRFALLSDWVDADVDVREDDLELLHAATRGVEALNRRHGLLGDEPRFLLLHRRRVWSDTQQAWIGWDRKRGKLHELNRFLRGEATTTTFVSGDGESPPDAPQGVKYVLTLDDDTRMPRDTVRRLVGKMAHPLNRPRLDEATGRVVEGYGVLQPRVTLALPGEGATSLFQRVFSGTLGIDPYVSAVSDVYQDLFGEGSYTGKGIYDVDAFESALAGRVPPETLLSHDLFEGTFARAGLVTDVEVVEDFPLRFEVASSRQHRWARGDWQLLPWVLGNAGWAMRTRDPARPRGTVRGRESVPALGRWKMLDNLRRTLLPPLTLIALVIGWATLSPGPAALWTVFLLVPMALPTLLPLLASVVPRRSGGSVRHHLRTLGSDLRLAIAQLALTVSFLAHEAWSMADAIVRTLLRLFVTRRNLLQWVPAGLAARGRRLVVGDYYRVMAPSVAVTVAAAVLLALVGAPGWPLALPFLVAWALAPLTARWASMSVATSGRPVVTVDDERALRLVARRTWRYFETFVTDADNALPPDNFQEDPTPTVAHRTSPTNIGLYLLATVSARDFGWIGTTEMVERLEATLATMDRMHRHRGHFANWYDTRDLRVLEPHYLSSVDSGNLCGHLIAVARACSEIAAGRLEGGASLRGIEDALAELQDLVRRATVTVTNPAAAADHSGPLGRLDRRIAELIDQIRGVRDDPASRALLTVELETATHGLHRLVRDAVQAGHLDGEEATRWASAVAATIASHRRDIAVAGGATAAGDDDPADGVRRRLEAVAESARRFAEGMDFEFLLRTDRTLLSIGYLVAEDALDPSCYDLLASEARLASFMAIAKDDVPAKHWFRLGRGLTPVEHDAVLTSWSGSMFEYLMPLLVMREPSGSLLAHGNRSVVRRQMSYAAEHGVPWGISESAYNARDLELNYQYTSFGVPDLGLKRGLDDQLVIAPYATALAAMIDPSAATANFERLRSLGAHGAFGFYEALDFTPARVPEGAAFALVRAFMAHHQGMTVVAIANTVLRGVMSGRFHAEPAVRATELVLQERNPRSFEAKRPRRTVPPPTERIRLAQPQVRRLHTPHDLAPQTQLLSNGRYTVMVSGCGSGSSRWGELAVTRWREDTTRDDWGSFVYLRDVGSGDLWSAGFQPTGVEPDRFHAEFQEDRVRFRREDHGVATTLDVLVSAEVDGEVRRVTLSNSGTRTREIDVTSYAELVLGSAAADAAHPAFSKMFVQTEHEPDTGALLATRRRRSPAESEVWAGHLCVVDGTTVGPAGFETDRARFLGRGRSPRDAAAVTGTANLSGTVGTVLDPVFALRRRIRLAPGGTARLDFWTLVASTRDEVLDLIDRHHDANAFARASTLAWTHAQVQLRHLRIDHGEAALFQRLASHVLYSGGTLRPSSAVLRRARGGASGLWRHGISGDRPIVLLTIASEGDVPVVRQLLRAHEYWTTKGLAVDLVILNEEPTSYLQELHTAVETMARAHAPRALTGAGPHGAIFVLRADQTAPETRELLLAAARAVLVGHRGGLADQLYRLRRRRTAPPAERDDVPPIPQGPTTPVPDLLFDNGLGGFRADGREYVVRLSGDDQTPAPWVNVVANPDFGFLVGAAGASHTWALNARERRLTSWSNDPVSDPTGEAIYLRDETSGAVWCPTAGPVRSAVSYVARHGFGYSTFEHTAHGIGCELVQLVPIDAPVKVSRLRLRNDGPGRRRLSVTGYVEWVLGTDRTATAHHVETSVEPATGALLARNEWNDAFGERTAFFDLGGRQTSWTGDRTEFIGRNGTLRHPAALADGVDLTDTVGAGLDPCGALRATLDLEPGEEVDLLLLLGETGTPAEARSLVQRYRRVDVDDLLDNVRAHWDDVLGTVRVRTPDPALDVMLNGWLLYQALASRVWARAGFYQASGAYGFRDQLQDGMALTATRPDLTRDHLLRAGGRQFVEGDVQHWWLPHSGQGVRTTISDGRVWLAHALAHYLRTTGDVAVLDERLPFLDGPPLGDEHEAFFQPTTSGEVASLYEHAARALDRSLATGAHGLPLIGSGDWNDGMNRVGKEGRGESVWLGWFLAATLEAFVPIAVARADDARARRWRTHVDTLRASLERHGWDGGWYRRAFFDDGTPLGSAESDECRIDAIAQSWSVISGLAPSERARPAMAAVDERLYDRERDLMLLFTPPFDRTERDPGYIRGYPPGLRENGGQYTHAALWNVIAFALLGDGDTAAELLATINPVHRTRTPDAVARYKVEPYVVAADVYAAPGHEGRGGWTWYTGSAAWMHRAGLEYLLGLTLRDGSLLVDPCIPRSWPEFELVVRHAGSTTYRVRVTNPDAVSRGVREARLDGVEVASRPVCVEMVADGREHHLQVVLGRDPSAGRGAAAPSEVLVG